MLEVLLVYKLQASGVGGHRYTHYWWLRISHGCCDPHYVCSNDLKMPSVTVVPGWEIEGLELVLEDARTGRSSLERGEKGQQTWLPSEMCLGTQITKCRNKHNTQKEGPQRQ